MSYHYWRCDSRSSFGNHLCLAPGGWLTGDASLLSTALFRPGTRMVPGRVSVEQGQGDLEKGLRPGVARRASGLH